MTEARRETLRSIMSHAWEIRRREAGESFSSCLRIAWSWRKRLVKATAKMARQVGPDGILHLSGDLTHSPIRNSLRGQRYAGWKAFKACYATAIVGR